MKVRNSLKMVALIALVTLGMNWGATNVNAQNQISDISGSKTRDVQRDDPFFHTGMFGITQNQTARINVANPDDGSFVPCVRVEVTFADGDGNTLSQKVYDIEAGKAASLDLKGSEIAGRDSKRAQVHATVRFIGTPDTRTYMWTPILEVFDNESGETRFILPAVQKVQKVQTTGL
jgi:hypothetical protein